jgi:hypothetical protein
MNLGFERTEQKEDWITPPSIPNALKGLTGFDLDPCASRYQKEFYAENNLFIEDDGLKAEWEGRVWMNPPYGRKAEKFMAKLAEHGKGTALIFSRTDTATWHKYIFPKASAILFMQRRVAFWKDGVEGNVTGGCGSALIAFSQIDKKMLQRANEDGLLKGYLVVLR